MRPCVCSCSLFWVATQNPRHACPVMQNYYRRTSNMPEDLRCLAWRRLADSLFTASNLDRTASKRLASALAMHTSPNPIKYLFKSCVSLQSQLNMRYHCICVRIADGVRSTNKIACAKWKILSFCLERDIRSATATMMSTMKASTDCILLR